MTVSRLNQVAAWGRGNWKAKEAVKYQANAAELTAQTYQAKDMMDGLEALE